MSKTKIIYWISTAIVVFICLSSGIVSIIGSKSFEATNKLYGLPNYLSPFLGVLKIAGGIAILFPAFKKIQEAAYNGLIFYFIGATYVLIGSGKGIHDSWLTILVVGLVAISYVYSSKVYVPKSAL